MCFCYTYNVYENDWIAENCNHNFTRHHKVFLLEIKNIKISSSSYVMNSLIVFSESFAQLQAVNFIFLREKI